MSRCSDKMPSAGPGELERRVRKTRDFPSPGGLKEPKPKAAILRHWWRLQKTGSACRTAIFCIVALLVPVSSAWAAPPQRVSEKLAKELARLPEAKDILVRLKIFKNPKIFKNIYMIIC